MNAFFFHVFLDSMKTYSVLIEQLW